MEQCIFCRIVVGELPNYTVFEDDRVLAFLDITPRTKGHTLVIPKVHGATLQDVTSEDRDALFAGVNEVMKILKQRLQADGFSVGWNHGDAGGQLVGHLHVHVMPRWKGDGGGNMHTIIEQPGEESVDEVAKLLV